uniref:Uncharacterized protein n=1 Tax=Trypanosoma congolense (strain IL3000) TaxID=1068625 RepID=G0UYS2_TRYCI|nr:conserved hypothetical protein [Trypanosoma congolense IL3000]
MIIINPVFAAKVQRKIRRSMKNALEQLEQHPLIGFQMDVSHLHSLLRDIMQEQLQQAHNQEKMNERLTTIENEMHTVVARQRNIEKSLDSATTDNKQEIQAEFHELRSNVKNLAADVKKLRHDSGESMRIAIDAKHGLHDLQKEIMATQQHCREISNANDEVVREHMKFTNAIKDIRWSLEEQDQQCKAMAREAESRVDDRRLHSMFDALCERTDKNFRNVEQSSLAVDAELMRLRADVNFIQNDMYSLRKDLHSGVLHLTRDAVNSRQSFSAPAHGTEEGMLRNDVHCR